MSFDITHLLDKWDYQAGAVTARRFKGKDGQEKIQLRIDLGVMQMNANGRPDGKRPLGHESLLEFFETKLARHIQENNGDDNGFTLSAEDCSRLQQEAIQYHHRYICLYELEDYDSVLRDTERNLAVFDFADEYAESDELAWSLQQFRPQLLLMRARAKGARGLKVNDFPAATQGIQEGLDSLRAFYRDFSQEEASENSGEILYLEDWLSEITSKRPLSKREQLEQELTDALRKEDYEKAAKVRDALKKL